MEIVQIKTVQDPVGNTILISSKIFKGNSCRNFSEVVSVLTSPAYMITVNDKKLYFFKLIDVGVNVMVKAQAIEDYFVTKKCLLNPSEEYVGKILSKGQLKSFIL